MTATSNNHNDSLAQLQSQPTLKPKQLALKPAISVNGNSAGSIPSSPAGPQPANTFNIAALASLFNPLAVAPNAANILNQRASSSSTSSTNVSGQTGAPGFLPASTMPLFAIGPDGKPVCVAPGSFNPSLLLASANHINQWKSLLAQPALADQSKRINQHYPTPVPSPSNSTSTILMDGTVIEHHQQLQQLPKKKQRKLKQATSSSSLNSISPMSSPALHSSDPSNFTGSCFSSTSSSFDPNLSGSASSLSNPPSTPLMHNLNFSAGSSPLSSPMALSLARPAKRPPKRRLKVKNPAMFALIDEMCSERLVGRQRMNQTQMREAVDQLEHAIAEVLSTMNTSLSKQDKEKKETMLAQLYRTRRKLLMKVEGTRDFDVDQWMVQYIKDDCVKPLLTKKYFKMMTELEQGINQEEIDEQQVQAEPELDSSIIPFAQTFKRKLLGNSCMVHTLDIKPTTSPFSGRKLMPFIWRDFEAKPDMLRIFEHIRSLNSDSAPISDRPKSIDYAYLRPYHVPQLNALLCRLFWPHIDVSSDLSYPDHAIVVLYGRRVIGCGIFDVGPTHSYITYLAVDHGFRNSGIASTLMYLLTSMYRKDILLHCQPTNWGAMRVYQKWGFKAEKFMVGFYDRYVEWRDGEAVGEWSTRGSRNAMYMRLRQ